MTNNHTPQPNTPAVSAKKPPASLLTRVGRLESYAIQGFNLLRDIKDSVDILAAQKKRELTPEEAEAKGE